MVDCSDEDGCSDWTSCIIGCSDSIEDATDGKGSEECKSFCTKANACVGEEVLGLSLEECHTLCDEGGEDMEISACVTDCDALGSCDHWTECIAKCE
ncbi:MAG: hypothetical protein JXR76_14660 [Deltaproteobacteria bacterium]|nr:hypothetical protein [Deltaproteobacteria bacterium]